jgi:hypothetical protein
VLRVRDLPIARKRTGPRWCKLASMRELLVRERLVREVAYWAVSRGCHVEPQRAYWIPS